MRGLLASSGLLFAVLCAPVARAEPLTASRVVVIARTLSPEARLAAARVREAQGRLEGARVRTVDNPEIHGTRTSGREPSRTELELSVPVGLGVARGYRIAEARAALEREGLVAEDAGLSLVGLALRSYYHVLHEERRRAIAADRVALAEELTRIATARAEAGDAARLDVLLAEAEQSRAKSELLAEEREVSVARLELARALGLPSGGELEVAGELGDRSLLDAATAQTPETRADVRAAEAEFRATEAALSLAGTDRIPALSLRVRYEREGSEESVSPGLGLSLPLFNRGQGLRAEARARRERASIELAALRTAAQAEAGGARSAYESMVSSAQELEERALPRALEVDALSRLSYQAGKLDLPHLLVVRGGALDTRREHADRLFEAADAAIELVLALGAWPGTP